MSDLRTPRVRFLTALEHSFVRVWLAGHGLRAHEDVPLPPGEEPLLDPLATLHETASPDASWDEDRLGVRPRRSIWDRIDHSLANAVARLCTRDAERREVHWRPERRDPVREVALRPQLLLSIEWTDEDRWLRHTCDYYSTWLPYYECTIVAGLTSSASVYHGYRELALGAFGPDTDLLAGVRQVLLSEWARFDGCTARFREFGLIDGPLARAWSPT